ncbi:MAG: hypothetical protein H2038_07210 [Brevundimonas sp.]|uniref:hypothetical protein n=1 Tax=Brevundimonas sp. TaxID=1871086 RepID=UPI00180E4A42|nr:hypothetical protein [Brevundimonas sp.]MBA4804421.1 hypothetical protein [Brevundimonas sp.]
MIRRLAAAAFTLALAATGPALAGAAAQESDQTRALALLTRAREAPPVQEAMRALHAATREAMRARAPNLAEREARGRAIVAEMAAAREAGDMARLNLIAGEADGLRAWFAELRAEAALDPAVLEARQRYVDAILARMTEMDPEAPALMERVRGLIAY